MNANRSRVIVVAGLVGVAVVAAACGSTATKAAPTVGAPSTAAPTANGSPTTAPAGPETNSPGDIPDNQAFVAFKPSGGIFTVTVPEGWAQSNNGAATVFTDKFNTIQIETTKAAAAPTTDSVTAAVVPALQAANANFSVGKVSTVKRAAGDAVLVTFQADSSPNPVTGKVIPLAFERYSSWHNGTEVTLTLSGATSADNVDPWKKITDSLTWAA
jgi:hypothetical protein